MYRILCLLVLVTFHGAHGEDCVPNSVQDLQLDLNSILHWSASTNCEDTSYLVYILFEDTIQHIYQTHDIWLDVSFLPACEVFRFILVAISENLASDGRIIESTLPIEPDGSVSVTQLVAVQQGEDNISLEWSLDEKFEKCVRYFRVVYWDGETLPRESYSTINHINISDFSPCTHYEFTVKPIYKTMQEGGIAQISYETSAHSLDLLELDSIRPGVTFADMTLKLPPYSINRCPISSLVVDGSPYINLTIPITDTPERAPVPVHVSPLQPDKMYLFRLYSINSGGASKVFQIAIQTQLP
ncbi:hypothetical protein NQ314_021352 [Rhamnusium bicolor]|uniref:Fibronectin type-III domain-containing protein n=1 Tax=Rhamnusium bicolor TaxID=1586634 RepID=A0AAV8WIU9_9CUCU|nr:hypothetical protein NQ314_021352 [Rhamnusium bicolor]